MVHLVATDIFWLKTFPPSKPGIGLYKKKFPRKNVFGTVVDYKKVWRLHPGKYIHLHQEDEPQNKINIDQTVREIVLGPQYKLKGGMFNVF